MYFRIKKGRLIGLVLLYRLFRKIVNSSYTLLLLAKHLATIEKMQNEVNDELQKVLNAYVFQEDIPPYDFNIHPITEEIVKDANPHVNIATRTKITKDKVYIIHPCFLFPRNLQTLKQ